MKTRRFHIAPEEASPRHSAILECAVILQHSGIVAIPTETVYGLAANALDANAVAKIFAAKERPSWDPLIVHVSDFEMISRVALDVPETVRLLAEKFWPGPLTLLLPKSPNLPVTVTAGRETVAVRMPAHPIAHALISTANLPLAAPSANRFGRTSPTAAEHVLRDLEGRIDAVLDAGPTNIGLESTVLDVLRRTPLLLRPGGITREQLEAVLGKVEVYTGPAQPAQPEALPSPGLAARHYAPGARLVLIDGTQDALILAIRKHVAAESTRGEYVGVMAPSGWIDDETLTGGGVVLFEWGDWGDWPQLAQNLFSGLRYVDKPGVSVILCPLPPEEGIGSAIRDRLLRAAQ